MSINLYKTLLEAVYSNNINNFLELAYSILKNPISLVDVCYNVIGIFPRKKLNDPLWDSLYNNNIVPYDMVLELSKGNYQKDLDVNDDILFIDYGIGKIIPRIALTCKMDNKILGYLCILFEETPYDENLIDVLKIISKATSILLLNNSTKVNLSYKQLDYFIESLILGRLDTKEKLTHALAVNNIKMSGNYLVFYTEVNDGSNNIVYLQQIKNIILNKHANMYCCIIDKSLYVLCHKVLAISSYEYEKSIKNFILNSINTFGFKFGFSNIFDDLFDIKMYCEQAKFAFMLSDDNSSKFCHYNNVIISDIFKSAQVNMSSRYTKNPILIKLKNIDYIHQTEYYKTLKSYILCFCNTTKASNDLNIHRNTLLYRLNKIREITGYDLNDSKLCIRLLCDFLLINPLIIAHTKL
ncbi:MAG TPA: hypothetical protein DG753_13190 [Clostridium sp.]|nr:hypothetical protein [Clostridium sp.]